MASFDALFRYIYFFLLKTSELYIFMPMTHISVFDFNDIFFVFVDGCQQFSLCFDEVLSDLGFVQEAGFFLEDEIWIGDSIPERISMSSIFFFFIVEFQ